MKQEMAKINFILEVLNSWLKDMVSIHQQSPLQAESLIYVINKTREQILDALIIIKKHQIEEIENHASK